MVTCEHYQYVLLLRSCRFTVNTTSMYCSSVRADLLILGFEQDTYQVSEANSSVVVCVNIADSIERSVMVNLQTLDGTAQG